jgi:large subunit ribosomal protein L35
MPKQKGHKGLLKRVKITATGKIKHHRPGASHLMSGKSAKRRRHMRTTALVDQKKYRAVRARLGM